MWLALQDTGEAAQQRRLTIFYQLFTTTAQHMASHTSHESILKRDRIGRTLSSPAPSPTVSVRD